MIKEQFYLFTFRSTHSAIEAQKVLKDCKPIIMPTLRAISSTCGISIRIEEEYIGVARELLKEDSSMNGMALLYNVERNGREDTPQLIDEY